MGTGALAQACPDVTGAVWGCWGFAGAGWESSYVTEIEWSCVGEVQLVARMQGAGVGWAICQAPYSRANVVPWSSSFLVMIETLQLWQTIRLCLFACVMFAGSMRQPPQYASHGIITGTVLSSPSAALYQAPAAHQKESFGTVRCAVVLHAKQPRSTHTRACELANAYHY